MRATAANSGRHKRPRGRQQMDLFDSARPEACGAPLWPELPERARSALTELMARLILARKPPAKLSITHKVCGDAHAESDVVEAVDAPPHDDISRRRVPGSVEIPAEPGKAVGVEGEIGWPPLPL